MNYKPKITLRTAEEGDLGFIKDLSARVFERYGPYEDMLPDWYREGAAATFVVLIEDKPVAFAMLGQPWKQGPSPRAAELLAIGVEPKRQRLGLGGLLMAKIEREAQERGLELLVLHTAMENEAAQKLFERNGFRVAEIKKYFYPRGQDAVMMYKRIKRPS